MTTKGMMGSLSEQELLLVMETEKPTLTTLDEDQLSELHDRIRRTRSKYVTQYRRGASARIAASGGRGKAAPSNRRAADKAEVFEEALARVSTALAAAARRSAADLRAERVAAARRPHSRPSSGAVAAKKQPLERTKRTATKTPVSRKNVAASQAKGARRQATRDSR